SFATARETRSARERGRPRGPQSRARAGAPPSSARGAAMKGDVATVADYIAKAPKWARGTLRELRRVIRKAAPEARESISYQMPYYSQNGRLAYFAAFRSHCSFFWL